ncbi:hypothetical protein C8Q76DRAFT_796003 [Earliella scabrosa]|nr:hypothetical protein C8Q76DRAFT_796003 [Earliella scabrosa]
MHNSKEDGSSDHKELMRVLLLDDKVMERPVEQGHVINLPARNTHPRLSGFASQAVPPCDEQDTCLFMEYAMMPFVDHAVVEPLDIAAELEHYTTTTTLDIGPGAMTTSMESAGFMTAPSQNILSPFLVVERARLESPLNSPTSTQVARVDNPPAVVQVALPPTTAERPTRAETGHPFYVDPPCTITFPDNTAMGACAQGVTNVVPTSVHRSPTRSRSVRSGQPTAPDSTEANPLFDAVNVRDVPAITHPTFAAWERERQWDAYQSSRAIRQTGSETVWFATCGPFRLDSPPSSLEHDVDNIYIHHFPGETSRIGDETSAPLANANWPQTLFSPARDATCAA